MVPKRGTAPLSIIIVRSRPTPTPLPRPAQRSPITHIVIVQIHLAFCKMPGSPLAGSSLPLTLMIERP
jgi:hypothetical protein